MCVLTNCDEKCLDVQERGRMSDVHLTHGHSCSSRDLLCVTHFILTCEGLQQRLAAAEVAEQEGIREGERKRRRSKRTCMFYIRAEPCGNVSLWFLLDLAAEGDLNVMSCIALTKQRDVVNG